MRFALLALSFMLLAACASARPPAPLAAVAERPPVLDGIKPLTQEQDEALRD